MVKYLSRIREDDLGYLTVEDFLRLVHETDAQDRLQMKVLASKYLVSAVRTEPGPNAGAHFPKAEAPSMTILLENRFLDNDTRLEISGALADDIFFRDPAVVTLSSLRTARRTRLWPPRRSRSKS